MSETQIILIVAALAVIAFFFGVRFVRSDACEKAARAR